MRPFGVTILAVLLAVSLVTGCGQGSRTEKEAGSNEDSPTTQETTSKDEAAGPEESFTSASEMSGGSEGAAESIQGIRLGEHEGYERAVIDFGLGDDSASQVPAWSLSSAAGEGYTRITFPDIEATAISNGVLGGSIMDNFYVVRDPGGGMFVDIFANGAFQYRVMQLSDPGRLAIDYRPASGGLSYPIPAQAGKTVLLQPREGEAITSPLQVSGYSRNFEASNIVALADSDGNVLSQTTAQSNDWTETWGYFEASLEFPAFEGPATLRVGGQSPRDGSFEGVELPVTYGGG